MIVPATPHHIAEVTRHLRREDEHECLAMSPWTTREELAEAAVAWGGLRYACVDVAGTAVAVAGLVERWPGVATAWAFGTELFSLYAIEITRACRRALAAAFNGARIHRVQAMSWAGHHEAHRWLEVLGFTREAVLRCFGRAREDYIVFARLAA